MIDNMDNTESTSGFAKADNHMPPRSATAIVNRKLEGNVISIGEADRLGLAVVTEDDDEEVWIGFGDGMPQKCIGKVVLIWSSSSHQELYRTQIKLQCYVLEHCKPALVFGKMFHDRRTEHWRKTGY